MSELTLFLIRLAYLAILWIFVLSALSVIRSDMFGARMPEGARAAAAKRDQRPPKPAKARRGAPTHVLVVGGDNQGERADLTQAPILIGRGPDADCRGDAGRRRERGGRSVVPRGDDRRNAYGA